MHTVSALDTVRGHKWTAIVAVGCLAATTFFAALLHLGVAALTASVTHDLGDGNVSVAHIVAAHGAHPRESGAALALLDRTLGERRRAHIARGMATLPNGLRKRTVTVLGISPSFSRLLPVTVNNGRWFADHEDRADHPVGLVGQSLVDSLFNGVIPPRIQVGGRWLDVIGTIETGPTAPVAMSEAIVVAYEHFHRLIQTTSAPPEMIVLEHDSTGIAGNTAFSLDDMWGVLQRRATFRGRLMRVTTAHRLGEAAQLSGTLRDGASRFTLVLLAASGAAVTALMLTIAHGQSRAVGIRRAVGATRRRITLYGLWIGGAVGAVGTGTGGAMALIVAYVVPVLFSIPALSALAVANALMEAALLPCLTTALIGAFCFARLSYRSPAQLLG